MGRTQRALTSLVAAIPAGFLSYLLVMVFLNSADSLKMMTQIIAGLTLACSALVTLMPIGLLVMGGRKASPKGAAGKPARDAVSSGEVDVVEDADVEEMVESSDAEVSEFDEDADVEEVSEFEMEDSDAEVTADSDDEIASGPASSLDEIESVDFEDEEDEPKPKKRKK